MLHSIMGKHYVSFKMSIMNMAPQFDQHKHNTPPPQKKKKKKKKDTMRFSFKCENLHRPDDSDVI